MLVAMAATCRAAAACAALCCLLTTQTTVVHAAYLEAPLTETKASLEKASETLASTAVPVFESLRPGSVAALETTLVDIMRDAVDPAELAKALELWQGVVQSSGTNLYADVSLDTCLKIPITSALIEALGAEAALKAVPQNADTLCLPPRERLAQAAKGADSAKVVAFQEQVQLTWKGAAKKAGFQRLGELNDKLIRVMRGAQLSERRAFKAAREDYVSVQTMLEALQRKQLEGPPTRGCWNVGCKAAYESGILVDDYLEARGMVKRKNAYSGYVGVLIDTGTEKILQQQRELQSSPK